MARQCIPWRVHSAACYMPPPPATCLRRVLRAPQHFARQPCPCRMQNCMPFHPAISTQSVSSSPTAQTLPGHRLWAEPLPGGVCRGWRRRQQQPGGHQPTLAGTRAAGRQTRHTGHRWVNSRCSFGFSAPLLIGQATRAEAQNAVWATHIACASLRCLLYSTCAEAHVPKFARLSHHSSAPLTQH